MNTLKSLRADKEVFEKLKKISDEEGRIQGKMLKIIIDFYEKNKDTLTINKQ